VISLEAVAYSLYCNTVELCCWWDWSLSQWPTGFLQCFDAVGWVIWPVKIISEMTYKVSSRTLSLYSLTLWWGSSWSLSLPLQPQRENLSRLVTVQQRWSVDVLPACLTCEQYVFAQTIDAPVPDAAGRSPSLSIQPRNMCAEQCPLQRWLCLRNTRVLPRYYNRFLIDHNREKIGRQPTRNRSLRSRVFAWQSNLRRYSTTHSIRYNLKAFNIHKCAR